MKIDVSEVKTIRECGRKWGLTSRNKFHLTSRNPSPNLNFGTVFHDGLARMYLADKYSDNYNSKIEEIIEDCCGKVPEDLQKTMRTMLGGYAQKVLPLDLEEYNVLVAEHHFKLHPEEVWPGVAGMFPAGIEVCGSIDLIVVSKDTGVVVGFEHKTCKNFRSPLYNLIDEQPMMYAIALRNFVEEYNKSAGTSYTAGGVQVNEVRKLKTRFEHKRLPVVNPDEVATERFLVGLAKSARLIKGGSGSDLLSPQPGYMKCQMCDFQEVCGKYGYETVSKEQLLKDFDEEYMERDMDHLEEKVEQDGTD